MGKTIKLIIFVVGLVGFDHPMKAEAMTVAPTFSSHHIIIAKMQEEIWKDIKGFENHYQISDCGRVKSLARTVSRSNGRELPLPERTLVAANDGAGYPFVGLSMYHKLTQIKVHTLVAKHFIPNPENKPQVNHIDGNKLNNNASNLEWVTSQENVIHAMEIGLSRKQKGENNMKNILTEKEVVAIRQIDFTKITQARVAKIYGVYYTCINKIIHRKTWIHI